MPTRLLTTLDTNLHRLRLCNLLQFIESPTLQAHAPEDPTLSLDQVPGRVEFNHASLIQDNEPIIVNYRS